MKTMYVVMGNAFPEAVFSTGGLADAFVDEKQKANAEPGSGSRARIYWRVYPFEVDARKPIPACSGGECNC